MRWERLTELGVRARRNVGGRLLAGGTEAFARAARRHPRARPDRHGVRVVRDVAYAPGAGPAHHLDVYLPSTPGPHPAVLYVHGGGFRILSKDTHWLMGLAFARRGYVLFNVNYRLAPRHPYPAALQDVVQAFRWVAQHAPHYGADPHRLVLAGESAGANLVTALAVALCWPRPEPWAADLVSHPVRPKAVVAACGILQVSDPHRFDGLHRRPLPTLLKDRLVEVTEGYLEGAQADPAGGLELADPLRVLEDGGPPRRPLPPFYACAGGRDPIKDDTRRLETALARLGVHRDVQVYGREGHAFHALVWRPQARLCWKDTFAFLEEALAEPALAAAR